jgi:2-phosphoglycerate kinase
MHNKIILISGGTGVGTSKYSLELVKKISNIDSVISTDSIREVLRSVFHHDINPNLSHSTYESGQTKNYSKKDEKSKELEIIRAYKNQCIPVHLGVESVINRAIRENISLIVEGIHIRPGFIEDSKIFKLNKKRFMQYLIKISDPEVHKHRFKQRQSEAPERQMEKYLKNFQEIRWIHDYLAERADKHPLVYQIDNAGKLENGLDQMLKYFYTP